MNRIAVEVVLAGMGLAAPSWGRDLTCSPIANSPRYVTLMRVGNRTMATDGRITQAEFMETKARR